MKFRCLKTCRDKLPLYPRFYFVRQQILFSGNMWQIECLQQIGWCNWWVLGLPRLEDMAANLWTHHQTSWSVRSAFMYPLPYTKGHAVGGSLAKPAWMNIRNTPELAQTVGTLPRMAFLTSEVSAYIQNLFHEITYCITSFSEILPV